jgi:hypothetical protein
MTILSVTFTLALPAVVQAAFPKTSDTTVVPSKSIGGFALGGSPQELAKAWGAPVTKCEVTCTYNAKNTESTAEVHFESKGEGAPFKAYEVLIRTAVKLVGRKDLADCSTPLTRYETSAGIHLCSVVSDLKKAYHAVKKLGSSTYVLGGPGEKETVFSIDEDDKIFAIAVLAHPGG